MGVAMKFLRENGLALVFGLLFLGSVGGQAIAGHADFDSRHRHAVPTPRRSPTT